jgi:plastocyanin
VPNGDAQTAGVGLAAADSLVVIVQEDGLPKSAATVTWSTPGTGASVSPTSTATDASGRAATSWTLGTVAGAQTARATLTGATGSPVTFNGTATVGPIAAITKISGDSQSTGTGTPFANPLQVKATDQYGNALNGLTATWSVQSGGVTLAGGATSTSNAQGIATKTINGGATVGAAVVRATFAGLADTRDFNLTVLQAPVRVTFGSNFFQSDRNSTSDPAVDTTVVGRPVLWTGAGGTHTVQSQGSPSFTSSGNLSGVGTTYSVTFNVVGTYQYDCSLHGSEMTGTIVVLP